MNMYNTALYAYGDDVSLIQNLPKVKDDFAKIESKLIQAPCYINPKMLEDHLGVDLR